MSNSNELLAAIEQKGLCSIFHKDWLIEIRSVLRDQLPSNYHVFVESETVMVTPDAVERPGQAGGTNDYTRFSSRLQPASHAWL